VVVSDLDAAAVRSETLSLGADAYFSTPFDVEAVTTHIRHTLEGDPDRATLFGGRIGNAYLRSRDLFREMFDRSREIARSEGKPWSAALIGKTGFGIDAQKIAVEDILEKLQAACDGRIFPGSWTDDGIWVVFPGLDPDSVYRLLQETVLAARSDAEQVLVGTACRIDEGTFGEVEALLEERLASAATSGVSLVRSEISEPEHRTSALLALSLADREFVQRLEGDLRQMAIEPSLYDQRTDSSETYAEDPPRLVLVDLDLEGSEGLYLIHSLRQAEAFSHSVVLALVDLARPNDVLRAFRMGADDYLVKPFEADVLRKRVLRLVRRFAPPSAYDGSETPETDVPASRIPDGTPAGDIDVNTEVFEQALGEAIRSLVEQNESFEFPRLGLFRIVHHPSRIERSDDGVVTVKPPRNDVEFRPDSTIASA
jgi:DNA-binding response OmpR family regulator